MFVPYDDPAVVQRLAAPRDTAREALRTLYLGQYQAAATWAATGAPALQWRRWPPRGRARGRPPRPCRRRGALGALGASSMEVPRDNGTRRALRAAVELLGQGLTSQCTVVDGGVLGDRSDGSLYDMHAASAEEHARWVTANTLNVARTLAEEVDAGRLDLDATLVVLTTEFGRSFDGPGGSNHATRGYATALLGGPIAAGRGGLVGRLDFDTTDDAQTYEVTDPCFAGGGITGGREPHTTATDLRAGTLLAAGLHPVQPDVFLADDVNVPPGTGADCAADLLANHLFGTGSATCP
ncbi:MAG: DUF1501 domain-containing protein [Myxococcota bacterium]